MAIDKLKDDTVIVFVDGSNLHTTPEAVQNSFAHESVFGSPLPIVTIFDSELSTMLGGVGHQSMKDPTAFDDVEAALAEYRGTTAAPSTTVTHAVETWKDQRGRHMQATYVSSTESEVTFKLEDGRQSTIEISTLSEESRARVAELAGK